VLSRDTSMGQPTVVQAWLWHDPEETGTWSNSCYGLDRPLPRTMLRVPGTPEPFKRQCRTKQRSAHD